MNCKSVQNRLSAYLDRELGGDELLQMRAHIAMCSHCRREVDGLRSLKILLGGIHCPEPPEGLAERLTASVMGQRIKAPRSTLRVSAMMFAGVSACSMLATLLVLNFGIGRHGVQPQSFQGQPALATAQHNTSNDPLFVDMGPGATVISAANYGPR